MAPNTTRAPSTSTGGDPPTQNPDTTTTSNVSALTSHKRAAGVNDIVHDLKALKGLHDLAEHIGDGSLAMELGSVEERALLAELQERGGDAWYMKEAGETWQLACLRARKYIVERALVLVENYMTWRKTFQVDTITPATSESLLSQLRAGIIRAPGTRDKLGRTCLVVDLSKHDPHKWNALETVRDIHCVFERVLLDNPEAQARGIVIVLIGTNIRFGNLDTRVPQELFRAFSKQLPIRLGGIYLIDPPWFMRIIFPIIRRFMPVKFQERMLLLGDGARGLLEHFDRDEILVELGGTKEYDHTAYVDRLVQLAREGQKTSE
eukprot:comp36857_c0_seq1/m.47333 comp36857_c0_seq1/g.47333  ORF comp36857_c0_seq1/g.47333 comp36857_c0_seq1/m.47333 type:complete len:321 (-) comp36857_c0_seq1:72-1034(-)